MQGSEAGFGKNGGLMPEYFFPLRESVFYKRKLNGIRADTKKQNIIAILGNFPVMLLV